MIFTSCARWPKAKLCYERKQLDAIARQFKDGASMTRLSRKHSLPLKDIEFVIRMKMLNSIPPNIGHG